MQRWRPSPSAGSLVGILALILCAGAIAGLILRAIPDVSAGSSLVVGLWVLVGILTLVSFGLVVLLWGYFTLSYTLAEAEGGALIIRWAWRTIRLPLAEIEYLGPARQLLKKPQVRRLWPWPGYYLNAIDDEALGKIRLFATLPPRRQILICSARGSFGISPDRPAAFAAQFTALNEAIESGAPIPLKPLATAPATYADFPTGDAETFPASTALDDEEEEAYPSIAANGQRDFRERTAGRPLSLFADRPAVSLILLGGALIAAMVWFILLRFDAVPQTLPLHYNATGQPDRIGTPREIFFFPLITALVAVANLALAWSVIRFDRFAARLLLGGTCLVQTVAWVALLKLF
ncbi:MAG TPA: DUF1648 domain-containing protein [Thermomicrobiales bacterium]